MAPQVSLKELKHLVKDFKDKIPKKSAGRDKLQSWADETGLTQVESKVSEISNKKTYE